MTYNNFHVARPKAALQSHITFSRHQNADKITCFVVSFPSFDMMTPPVAWGATGGRSCTWVGSA